MQVVIPDDKPKRRTSVCGDYTIDEGLRVNCRKEAVWKVAMFEHIDPSCSCEGKYCNQCNQIKCHKAFHKDRRGSLGLRWRCKDCQRTYVKENTDQINKRRREYKAEHREHFNEYDREYRRKNPEPKKARDRKYREEHLEKIALRDRNYKRNRRKDEQYRAQAAEYNRQYRQLHPEQNVQNFNNRRARKQRAGGSFATKEWRDLCEYYKYTCPCCGRSEPEIKLTADHVIPLSRGGSNFIDNIQPLCLYCNLSKHAKTIDYRFNWREENI